MKRAAGLLVGLVAAGAAVAVSCREPTAIVLNVATDVPCTDVTAAGGVDIRVGSPSNVDDAPTTRLSATTCIDGKLGTLVVVPSGSDDDQVGIVVSVATKSAPIAHTASTECTSAAPGNCVVARRILRYVKHTSLPLPVTLSRKCTGVACGRDQTCVEGTCFDARVPCTESGCDPPPPIVDAGPVDAPADVADAGPVDAACSPDLLTDPKNCGACGTVCPGGACVAGACKLTTVSTSTGEGCIAATASNLVFTWNAGGDAGAPGHGYLTDKAGSTLTATEPFPITAAQVVTASSAQATYLAAFPPSTPTVSFHFVKPPTSLATTAATPLTVWVSTNDLDQSCWLRSSGAVACTGNIQNTTTQTEVIATGNTMWAAVGGNVVHSGSIASGFSDNKAVVVGGTTHVVTAKRGSNTFFFDVGTNIMTVVPVPSQPPAPSVVFAGAGGTILGMVYDGSSTTLYWAEGPAPFSLYARNLLNGPLRKLASNLPLTTVRGRACLEVDATSLYFLVGGAPFKIAK